jgi:hypothetical protein
VDVGRTASDPQSPHGELFGTARQGRGEFLRRARRCSDRRYALDRGHADGSDPSAGEMVVVIGADGTVLKVNRAS